jgi:hypothetical protein
MGVIDHWSYHGALLGSAGSPLKPFQSVTSNHLVRFRSSSPRKNLPHSISRKRAEANFLFSFEQAFVLGYCQTKQITWLRWPAWRSFIRNRTVVTRFGPIPKNG